MMLPKVSIVIPVYNGSNYLSEAIDCALNQSYQNIEIIVVNDGSTDNGQTENIALSYGEHIRYFKKENGGVSSALNYGIKQMTGDYFSWLSHDDLYSNNKVEDAVSLLEKHQQIGKKCIAFTSGKFIDSSGNGIKNFLSYFDPEKLYSGLDVVDIMTKKGTLNGCCMLIPGTAFEEVALFDETLRYSQDSLMWYQLFLSNYSLISDDHLNVMYRLHRKQTSQNGRKLYEHDAYVIAEVLSKKLVEADASGELFFNYLKRLTNYYCKDAINYMFEYEEKNKLLSSAQKHSLVLSKYIGFVRYYVVKSLKKILFLFR